MRRKSTKVEDKMVRPAEDKAPTLYIRLRPGRSVRANGALIHAGQVVRVERSLAEQWIASGYADYIREA